MITKPRQLLVDELIQSYQQVRQLFIKQLHTALHHQGKQACFAVLKILHKHGAMSQHAIAEALLHSDAAISRQIKLLLQDKYVTSSVDPANRRRTIITLTKRGRALFKTLEHEVHQQVAELLAGLSDSRLKQLIKANQDLQQLIIKT